ncbi:MAG: CDP-diacylglycerol--glycerol-3-phosphate 3-phosphatidyltransferase [Myxococcales bacterium]|nr:CDP-diacylglycerol--glycerol-3-phosphate 3-phosphatidyltransferase [Myxococcales bacterium]
MPSAIRNELLNLPNMLTLLRVALIPVVVYLLLVNTPTACIYASLLFGAAAITDFLDGYLARAQGLVSVTGKFLDPLADKLLVMAALVALVELDWLPSWLVILVLAREFMINGLRTLAANDGIVIAAGTGGKYKTAFQLTGLPALMLHYQYDVDLWFVEGPVRFHHVGLVLFGISVGFSLWSAVTYTVEFYRESMQMV